MRPTDYWRALIIIKAASRHYSVDSLAVLTAQKTLRVPMQHTQTTHLDLQLPSETLTWQNVSTPRAYK